MADTPSSQSPSRSSTPNPRFTAQAPTAEELLKEQTVGLVHLSDFRKRRAEALDQVSRDGTPAASGTSTPDGRESATKIIFKKRKKEVKKGGLSFGADEDEQEQGITTTTTTTTKTSASALSRSETPTHEDSESSTSTPTTIKKRLKPSTAVSFQPKAQTKSALLREAQLKDSLRKEYALMQEAVKQTDFCLPFVFFDGKNAPGGVCRMKKGDFVWLFLERARKVGAEKAASGHAGGMRDWARISVDDLMLVKGELIIPHHYDFHYFMLNRTTGYKATIIFHHSAEPTAATPHHLLPSSAPNNDDATPPAQQQPSNNTSHLTTAADRQSAAKFAAESRVADAELEGYSDDPASTKVVDRRWYERNKHIYPASMWEEFDPKKDYASGTRTDGEGNAYFFSR